MAYEDYQEQPEGQDSVQTRSPAQPNCQLARAYVLDQPYARVLSPEEALHQGTLFADLVMPYMMRCQEGLQ